MNWFNSNPPSSPSVTIELARTTGRFGEDASMSETAGPSAETTARAADLGLVVERLAETIDRDTYTPALLGLLNNVLVWGGSRVFHHLHGIGTNEWRVLSALANHPGSTAQELCAVLGINKSIVSKSVNLLLDRDLIADLDGPRGSRFLYLTSAGAQVHDDVMPIALERQAILHSALGDAEIAQLNELLVRMLAAGDELQAYERGVLSDASRTTRSAPNGVPGA